MIKVGQLLENFEDLNGFIINSSGKYELCRIPQKSILVYLETTKDISVSFQNVLNWSSLNQYDSFWKKTARSRFSNYDIVSCLYNSQKVFIFHENSLKEKNE